MGIKPYLKYIGYRTMFTPEVREALKRITEDDPSYTNTAE
jgi:hypothetical protein